MSVKKHTKAFLLFEAMVAIIVLTSTAAIVLRSFNSAIAAIKGLKDYTVALFLAEQKMFEVEVGLEGDITKEQGKFSCDIDSVPLEEVFLNKINLSIFWNSAASTKKFSIQTYIKQR
jgi:Tfp pilus assembly major pilin PilA